MGAYFDKQYGSDMSKHNLSHKGCLHGPKVVPTYVISIWVMNWEIHTSIIVNIISYVININCASVNYIINYL